MLYWLWLVFLPVAGWGDIDWKTKEQGISVNIVVQPQEVTLDQTFSIQVSLHYPSAYDMNVQTLIEQLTWSANPLRPKVLLKSQTLSSDTEKGYINKKLLLTLAPLEQGQLDLSFLALKFKAEKPVEILSPVFQVRVLPPAKLDVETFPVGPLLPLQPEFPLTLSEANRQFLYHNTALLAEEAKRNERILAAREFPWRSILFLAALILGSWLINMLYQNRKPPPLPAVPLHLQTLEALQRLRPLAEQGHFKAFYARLAQLALIYLEKHFHVSLTPYTTQELQPLLVQLPLPNPDTFLNFLKRADAVKFAHQPVSLADCLTDEQFIEQLVTKTLIL